MRKYFSLVLAVLLAIFLCAPIGMASDTPSIEHYTVINNSGSATHTHIGVTTLYPGKDRILGFTVAPVVSGSGTLLAGLYDAATDAQMTDANLMGERGGVNTSPVDQNFVALGGPVSFANGITVSQGAYTSVTIYYEITVGH